MNPLVNTSSTEGRIRDLMYEHLLAKDLKGAIQPRLAECWEISKDRKDYTFKLRRGVKFHNGAEMTADDIKFAIDDTINPKNGAYGLEDLSAVERAEVVDKYTLRMHLKQPNPVLLAALQVRSFSAFKECLAGHLKPATFPRLLVLSGSSNGCRASVSFSNVMGLLGPRPCRPRVVKESVAPPWVSPLHSGDVDIISARRRVGAAACRRKIKGIGIIGRPCWRAQRGFNVADSPFNNEAALRLLTPWTERK
jgi:hypothetical protein